jgi:ubiquinone/menaquinone biosynthesis C-methylase UbiE
MSKFTMARIWTPRTYNWLSRYYDRFSAIFSPEIGHRAILRDLKPGSLLDVGCGTGTLIAKAGEIGMDCSGLDTSTGMLKQTSKKAPGTNLILASFYSIPFDDASFDYVVESNALGGVGIDVKEVISEMFRVCKPGGEIRIADYCLPTRETWLHRLLIKLGTLIGDYPIDIRPSISNHGCSIQTKILAGYGMYQLISLKKLQPQSTKTPTAPS